MKHLHSILNFTAFLIVFTGIIACYFICRKAMMLKKLAEDELNLVREDMRNEAKLKKLKESKKK